MLSMIRVGLGRVIAHPLGRSEVGLSGGLRIPTPFPLAQLNYLRASHFRSHFRCGEELLLLFPGQSFHSFPPFILLNYLNLTLRPVSSPKLSGEGRQHLARKGCMSGVGHDKCAQSSFLSRLHQRCPLDILGNSFEAGEFLG